MKLAALPALDAPYRVEADTVARFQRDGHVAVPGLATRAEVDAYRPIIESAVATHNLERRRLEERDTYGKAFLQTMNLWRVDAAVANFVLASRFASVAAALLQVDRVRLYHDQALFKEAGGGPTPWHQDQYYWPLADPGGGRAKAITMWMPLQDLAAEVGSMVFASGSHQHGPLTELPISDASEVACLEQIRSNGFPIATHGALRAGDATFHAGWTLHSAGPNPTAEVRPVMTVIYLADGLVVAEPTSPEQEFDRHQWLAGRPAGSPINSPLNPLL
jgi:ectoine hydroxylase-related dioxygenase (phytanoyl-CoA dioxygenase family)